MHEIDSIILGDNIASVEESSSNCMQFRMNNESGEGLMTLQRIFDGVFIMFNDFHMNGGSSKLKIDADVFCIDHCREGRIEHRLPGGTCSYISAGDLRIDNRSSHYSDYSMPLSHYHGVTIAFFLESASRSLSDEMKGFPVSLEGLHSKYCPSANPYFIRAEPLIDHLFSEIYAVPSKVKDYYLKIKIFELLLYLDALELSSHDQSRPYFYKAQVEKIKLIREFITENIDQHFTLEMLSEHFDIPLTSMKSCFKGVYGTSIYAYVRSCRMNRAAVLLRNTEYSVARIAGDVGYCSPSKFAAAFREVMSMTPVEYRKLSV